MDDEVNTDAGISDACATPDEYDLIEKRLPNLSATPISVCRRLVLQQAVEALGFTMHETTTHDDETNEMLTAIRINVPPHIQIARMKTRVFYGDWSLTTDAAVQSACFNALGYLQKVHVVTIDGIHSAELKHCRRELLQTSSWAEAFEQHADKLQSQLSAIVRGSIPVLPITRVPAEFLPPSGPAYVTRTILQEQGTSSGLCKINGNLPFGTRKRNDPLPVPGPAVAAFNRKKRKLIIRPSHSRVKAASLPSLPLLDCSSSEKISTTVTDLCDEVAHVSTNHIDPGCAFLSLSTPSSVRHADTLRTRTVTVGSKVLRPLFRYAEDREKEAKAGDIVLSETGGLSETDEVMEDTQADSEYCTGSAPLPATENRESQTAEGMPNTSGREAKP